jgi:hypothetical protein
MGSAGAGKNCIAKFGEKGKRAILPKYVCNSETLNKQNHSPKKTQTFLVKDIW